MCIEILWAARSHTPAECYVWFTTDRSAGAGDVGSYCGYKHIAPLEQRVFCFRVALDFCNSCK